MVLIKEDSLVTDRINLPSRPVTLPAGHHVGPPRPRHVLCLSRSSSATPSSRGKQARLGAVCKAPARLCDQLHRPGHAAPAGELLSDQRCFLIL